MKSRRGGTLLSLVHRDNHKIILLYLFVFFIVVIISPSCKKDDFTRDVPRLSTEKADVAVKWADMTLYAIRFSAFNTPTYSSRSLGYLGLAMYECTVNGYSANRSMNGQLNGLTLPLPLPAANQTYHWLLALNAGQDTLLKLLYPVPGNSHRYIHEKIDSLSNAIFLEMSNGIDKHIVERSVQFGRDIALAIYNWSLTDGGDQAYTRNFEPSFVFPSGPSYWVPPVRG